MYCASSASTIHGYETPFSSNAPRSPRSKTGASLTATGGMGRCGSIVMIPMRDRFRESRPLTYTSTRSSPGRGTAKDGPVQVAIHSRPASASRIRPSLVQPPLAFSMSARLAGAISFDDFDESHEFGVHDMAAVEVTAQVHVHRELERHVVVPQDDAVRVPIRQRQHPGRISMKRVIEREVDAVRQEIGGKAPVSVARKQIKGCFDERPVVTDLEVEDAGRDDDIPSRVEAVFERVDN